MCYPLSLLWFCVPLGASAFLGSQPSYLMLLSVRLFVFLYFCCASLCLGCPPLFCLAVWLLLAPLPVSYCFSYPAVAAMRRPGPVFTLVPLSGCLVACCDGSVALLSAGSVVVLCCPPVTKLAKMMSIIFPAMKTIGKSTDVERPGGSHTALDGKKNWQEYWCTEIHHGPP